jgi:hypothetical protein
MEQQKWSPIETHTEQGRNRLKKTIITEKKERERKTKNKKSVDVGSETNG